MAMSPDRVKEIADRAEGIKPNKPEARTGRPSRYKDTFAKQAEKLCALGATDEDLADFFEVHRTEDEFLAFALALIRQDRRGIRKERREKRAMSKLAAMTHSKRVRAAVSARMWAALKGRTDGALFSRLGYSVAELTAHLERQFQPGMSWENYGKWHVDHARPCALFDQADPEQFAKCWALENLQPLWAEENLRKGARYASA